MRSTEVFSPINPGYPAAVGHGENLTTAVVFWDEDREDREDRDQGALDHFKGNR